MVLLTIPTHWAFGSLSIFPYYEHAAINTFVKMAFFHLDYYLRVFSQKWDYQVKGYKCFIVLIINCQLALEKNRNKLQNSQLCVGFPCRT